MNDGLIEKVVEELDEALAGGILSRIDQPAERCLVLRVFNQGRSRHLLLSAGAPYERIHLTDKKTPNPLRPPRFCALLRSRIKNARIIEIRKLPGERIVEMGLGKKSRHEAQAGAFVLRIELTGRSSNIILLDEKGVVVDALRYFRPGASPRVVVPGQPLEDLPGREPAEARAARGADDLPEKKPDESWNELACRYYAALSGDEAQTSYRRQLRRVIARSIKKTEKKIENLEKDRERARSWEDLGHFGELILPHMGEIKRGEREAHLMDYTLVPPRKVAVPLDERLGPRENAERYFKKAKKARRALGMLARRIPETGAELEYLLGLGHDLETAETIDDLYEVEDALVRTGYMKPEDGCERKSADKRGPGPAYRTPDLTRRFVSSEGLTVILGRNARGNDEIVRKKGSKGDIWLHAKGVAGSHVLIKTGGRDIAGFPATLRSAASLAAWHSRARKEEKAEVIYTDLKHVSKPRGARPGMVRVREFRTILVRPEEKLREKK